MRHDSALAWNAAVTNDSFLPSPFNFGGYVTEVWMTPNGDLFLKDLVFPTMQFTNATLAFECPSRAALEFIGCVYLGEL